MNGLLKVLIYGTSMLAFLCNGTGHASEQACSVKDRTDALVLMFCPGQLNEKAWIEAGKSACGLGQLCNVWIWDDRSKMPGTAPNTDAELSKKHAGAAVAIWVNDSQSLMKLKKVH